MALRTPPSWLQNASHPAENDRLSNQALYATTGVIGTTSLAVTQSAVPAMSVSIAAGWAAIVGDYQANQGVYMAYNDAALTATITAANPTLPRIDRVCITVNDSAYTGSLNNVVVNVVAGTPNASPVAPATPTNSISLATISIPAADTAVLNADITDTRVQVTTNLQIGDITAVNAGTGISGGGTSGAVTVTNSMATAITTSGDLIQGTGSGTFARLGSGTNGQYLTTNGTTLSWVTPTAGATINYLAFTSSQTWTVPSSAKYVDVFVVGGGSGGKGGRRATSGTGQAGCGGGVTMFDNIFLNGTGTVAIVVGAGSSGTAGTSTTSDSASAGNAGFSAFGDYCYSQGARGADGNPGLPAYKGTYSGSLTSRTMANDYTQSNFAPITILPYYTVSNAYSGAETNAQVVTGLNAYGLAGGFYGNGDGGNAFRAGGVAGFGQPPTTGTNQTTMTLPSPISSAYNAAIGAATAGTAGQGATGTGGAAGIAGFAGGGGSATPTANAQGGQGGHGAGGGGSWPISVGLNGGNGGNAGTNTGAGGGGGACTGNTTAGTGGTGGNGAAGIVVVKWIS
jgi:hypothetical protein